jgi:hypothetical protein
MDRIGKITSIRSCSFATVKLQRFLVDTWTRLLLGFEMYSERSALRASDLTGLVC